MNARLPVSPRQNPSAKPRFVIGIDGGGTRSVGAAVDFNGRVLATARAGSLNFLGSGLAVTRQNLRHLKRSLWRRLPNHGEFVKAVVGCAALFSEATKSEKEKLCRGIFSLDRTRVVSDCETALFGATLGRFGVVVIAGTGSIVLARSEAGPVIRVGGWGHLLGDEGSAYWIAVESVKSAIADEEQRGPRTRLTRLVRRWFHRRRLVDMVPLVYRDGFAKEKMAGLAVHLAGKSGARDHVFRGLCERAGRLLAEQALAAIRRMEFGREQVAIHLVGSVLENNGVVRRSFIKHCAAVRRIRIVEPSLPAWLGAAALALQDAGVALDHGVLANLAKAHRRA